MRTSKVRETMNAVKAQNERKSIAEKGKKAARCAYALGMAASTFASAATIASVTAFAEDKGGAAQADTALDQIVDVMKKVMKYVGIGLCIFGVYELAMAFLQQAPEQKTKGILIIVVGAIMTGMDTFIDAMRGNAKKTS